MELRGLFIGLFSFAAIGAFHPVVIKCEYYFTDRVWPVFLALGAVLLALSLAAGEVVSSACLSVLGFTCLWSIGELRHQTKRVEKGWFPQNPRRAQAKGKQELQ